MLKSMEGSAPIFMKGRFVRFILQPNTDQQFYSRERRIALPLFFHRNIWSVEAQSASIRHVVSKSDPSATYTYPALGSG
jgi:hypothetical protein